MASRDVTGSGESHALHPGLDRMTIATRRRRTRHLRSGCRAERLGIAADEAGVTGGGLCG
jgi:hypothetical protein